MRVSLQSITDFYLAQGYRGTALRAKLSLDRTYQQLLKARKKKLTRTVALTRTEKKKYVLSLDQDYEILQKVKQLKKFRLGPEEKFIVEFIRTQLELDWRKKLLKELNKMLRKYSTK